LGSFPRGAYFATPNRLIVGGQDSGNVVVFEVDVESGMITEEALFNGDGFGTPVAFATINKLTK